MATLPTIIEAGSEEERGGSSVPEEGGESGSRSSKHSKGLWLALCLLGFGLLLPFNIVLNAIPYFEQKLGPSVVFEVAPAYTTPQLMMQLPILLFAHKIKPLTRLFTVCVIQAVVMALCPFLAVQSLTLNFLLMACSGAATATMESSLFGFASLLPSYATGGLMAGEALAGLLSALSQLLFKAIIPGDSTTAALWYFFTAALALAASAYCAWKLRRSDIVLETGANTKRDPFTLLHLSAEELNDDKTALAPNPIAAPAAGNETSKTTIAVTAVRQDHSHSSSTADFHQELASIQEGKAATTTTPSQAPVAVAVPSQATSDGIEKAASSTNTGGIAAAAATPRSLLLALKGWFLGIRRVLKGIWPAALAVFLNFVCTFLAIPGVIASIPYRGDVESFVADPGLWTNVLFAVFSLFDLIGRLATPLTPKFLLPQRSVLIYSCFKFLLVPLVVGSARGWWSLDSDMAALFSVAAIAMTNGHCVSLAMMAAPRETKEERDKELAGFVSVLFLHAGISAGSILALGLEQK
jgi:Nucleoside transporter